MPMFSTHAELVSFNKGKQVPQFAASVRDEAKRIGAAAFALSMPFDEAALIEQNLAYLLGTLSVTGVKAVHVYTASDALPEPDMLASAAPGKPSVSMFFSETIQAPQRAPKPSVMAYLEKHGVAGVLDEAVNKLGTEQPADPFAWLSAYLAKKS